MLDLPNELIMMYVLTGRNLLEPHPQQNANTTTVSVIILNEISYRLQNSPMCGGLGGGTPEENLIRFLHMVESK